MSCDDGEVPQEATSNNITAPVSGCYHAPNTSLVPAYDRITFGTFRVYHTAVSTGGRDHQPASLDVDAGRNLMVEPIRSPIDCATVHWHFVRKASEAVVDSDLHPRRSIPVRMSPVECDQ
jgi:hypothetical protein